MSVVGNDCAVCGLFKGCLTPYMQGVGPKPCDVMFIGEAPGEEEDRFGEPFVGLSGKKLQEIFEKVDIDRNKVFISNVVRCRPKDNVTPSKTEITLCKSAFLVNEIRNVNPKLIVCLGAVSYNSLFPKGKITKDRGILHKHSKGFQVLPTFHPSYILRFPKNEIYLHKDLMYAKELIDNNFDKEKSTLVQVNSKFKNIICKTKEDVEKLTKRLKVSKMISFDLETYGKGIDAGLDPFDPTSGIICASFSWDDKIAAVIPVDNYWNGDRPHIVNMIKDILKTDIPKVGQNIKFDLKFLKLKLDIDVNGFIYDTYLEHFLLDEEGSHGLKDLTQEFLNEEKYDIDIKRYIGGTKAKADFRKIPFDILVQYAGKDAEVTLRLHKILWNQLEPQIQHLYRHLIEPVMKMLMRMEVRGIKVDRRYINTLKKTLSEKIIDIEKNVRSEQMLPKTFNFDSTMQVQDLLFKKLGLSPVKKTKRGFSVDKETMKILASYHSIPAKLAKRKKYVKLLSTYVDGILKRLKPGDLIHTTFNLGRAVTGRLSSSGGVNLQNIPRVNPDDPDDLASVIKQIFISRDTEWSFFDNDFRQAEIVWLCEYTRSPLLRDAILGGKDIHCELGSKMYNCTPEEVKSNKALRTAVKNVVFGVIYGRGPKSISEQLKISKEEAVGVINSLFRVCPEAKKFIKDTHNFVKRNKYIDSIFGRRRHLYHVDSIDRGQAVQALRQAVNCIIQSAASDLNLLTLLYLEKQFIKDKIPCYPIATVHDSCLMEVKDDVMETVYNDYFKKLKFNDIVKDFAIDIFSRHSITVDAGKTWGTTKQYDPNTKVIGLN